MSLGTLNGLTSGFAGEPIVPDPGREVVVGGLWAGFSQRGGYLYAQAQDEVVRQYGSRVYELMSYDDACSAALWFLIAGTLAEGVQLTPSETEDPAEENASDETIARHELAQEVYESCQRVVSSIEEQVHQTLTDLLADGLVYGCAAAEGVFGLADKGEDAGRQVPTVFRAKPRWAWQFRVDPFLNVDALRCYTVDGWRDIERDHFCLFTWQPRDGDPRGSSVFRPAYAPFNTKLQVFPDYGEYLKKFASASLVMTAGPEAMDQEVLDDVTGRYTKVSIQQQLLNAAVAFRNHSALALPYGCTATVLHSQGNGEAFDKAFDRFDRQIFRSVVLATRPLQEAKHGSKADSESGLDVFDLTCTQVRRPLAGAFRRDFLMRYVALNWGDEVARDLTPKVTFGASDHISPNLMLAFAEAWSKGVFEPEQKGHIWSKLGIPTPPNWDPSAEPDPGDTSVPAAPGQDQGAAQADPNAPDTTAANSDAAAPSPAPAAGA